MLEWLTELRKTIYLLGDQFTIRDTSQEQPDGRDTQGKMWRKGVELGSMPSLGSQLSQQLYVFSNLEVLSTP